MSSTSYADIVKEGMKDKTFAKKEHYLENMIKAEQSLAELVKVRAFKNYLKHRLAVDTAYIASDDEGGDFKMGKTMGRVQIIMELRSDADAIESRLRDLVERIDRLRKDHNPNKRMS